jgi:1,2-phenylacetyl-CoA epoxidase catalytic subunit
VVTYTDIEKEKEVKKEFNKIKKIFSNMPDGTKKLNAKLMYNAAWLAVSLDDLTATMDENGVVIEYKNGENQYGTKKSPESELYTSWSKQYTSIMKQLSDLLPKGDTKKKDDPLLEFIKR